MLHNKPLYNTTSFMILSVKITHAAKAAVMFLLLTIIAYSVSVVTSYAHACNKKSLHSVYIPTEPNKSTITKQLWLHYIGPQCTDFMLMWKTWTSLATYQQWLLESCVAWLVEGLVSCKSWMESLVRCLTQSPLSIMYWRLWCVTAPWSNW